VAVHVHANAAMTLDGCVGGPGRTPLRISDAADTLRVHELRARVDAVAVGVGTVVADDPKLTVKWELLGRTGPQPRRVVFDPRLRTPETSHVRRPDPPTVFVAASDAPAREGWDVERVGGRAAQLDLVRALERLEARGVQRMLLEGGPTTLRRFLEAGVVDVLTVYVAPRALGAPEAPRLFESEVDLARTLRAEAAQPLGEGFLMAWRRR
jgi:2,5-diamino-6-(ribosylamino)-4(3H)-pyrimidinone 5'-phosphate reductase